MTADGRKDFFKRVQDMEEFVRIDFKKEDGFDYQALKEFLSRFGKAGLRLGSNSRIMSPYGIISALRYNVNLDGKIVVDTIFTLNGLQMLLRDEDEPRSYWINIPTGFDELLFQITFVLKEGADCELFILKHPGLSDC